MVNINVKKDTGYVSKYFVEFKDKELEEDFLNHEIGNALKYIKPALLIFGGLCLLFIVPDYFLIKNNKIFNTILINRIFILMLIVLLHIRLKHEKNYTALSYWFTVYEIIISLSFLLILYQYEAPNFLMHSLGVIIVILSIFLIPNKWKHMVFASVTVSISYFAGSLCCFKNIKLAEFSSCVVYITLIIILSSVSSYHMNYYKRVQYIHNKNLVKMSVTDSLTGIYNRAKFNQELVRWVEMSKRYKSHLSLAIFDIDDFKKINDNYGHMVGDKVLVDIVNIVRENKRKTDIFARWGGEEFVILLPNTKVKQAVEMIERLRILIAEYTFEKVGHISCSFGVVSLEEKDDIDTFLHRADERLYLAKDAGKNIVL